MALDRTLFENLKDESFSFTSDETDEYNCIAYAAGVTDEWWEPIVGVWPDGLPLDCSAGTFVSLFERCGYCECNDAAHEEGYEKIAIFVLGRDVEHAARQMPNGKWTSKMGPDEDIEHESLNDIAGSQYGHPARFLKRRFPQ